MPQAPESQPPAKSRVRHVYPEDIFGVRIADREINKRCWQGDEASRLNDCILKAPHSARNSASKDSVPFLQLPHFNEFTAKKIALHVRYSKNLKSFTWKNVLNWSGRLLVCQRELCGLLGAIPHLPYHKEECLWVVLADSNNVWFFQKTLKSLGASVEAKNNGVREGDARISCDQKTSLKVEVLRRTNDFEGEVAEEGMEEEEEDENEENYESKYSEDEEDKRKGSFDQKKGSKIVNKMGRVPKSRAQMKIEKQKGLKLALCRFCLPNLPTILKRV
ncbi:hypothetical protein DY000_02020515 [Brassica cretica]|uniref:Uncharacterized protein n=1 Tax=Brassica cretica TaxID=69181 RepID=A0ABQ7EHL5_BRACR|nr:hypothetical protein DY000_02020515 [Brassica cretica]